MVAPLLESDRKVQVLNFGKDFRQSNQNEKNIFQIDFPELLFSNIQV